MRKVKKQLLTDSAVSVLFIILLFGGLYIGKTLKYSAMGMFVSFLGILLLGIYIFRLYFR